MEIRGGNEKKRFKQAVTIGRKCLAKIAKTRNEAE